MNLRQLFNAKAILLEEQQWCYLTPSWLDNGAHIFPKCVCLKVNVIVQLEFEIAYYDSAVQHFNHYTMITPASIIGKFLIEMIFSCPNFWDEASWFYNSGFSDYSLHLYCYIVNVSADMSSGLLQVFLV